MPDPKGPHKVALDYGWWRAGRLAVLQRFEAGRQSARPNAERRNEGKGQVKA